MYKIAITTMIWKRPEVFEIWAAGIKRLKKDFPKINFIITVTGSEGGVSRKLVKKFKFEYHEYPNEPIGAKANARLQFTRTFKPDYVLFMGSDDLISSATFAYYLKQIKKGYQEIAPLDLYYWYKGQIIYSYGYQGDRFGEPVAVGRMLKANVLDHFDWKMWDADAKRYLDGQIRNKVKLLEIPYCYYSCRQQNFCILDIKTDVNMTPFKWRPNYESDSMLILKNFSKIEQRKISQLCVE